MLKMSTPVMTKAWCPLFFDFGAATKTPATASVPMATRATRTLRIAVSSTPQHHDVTRGLYPPNVDPLTTWYREYRTRTSWFLILRKSSADVVVKALPRDTR